MALKTDSTGAFVHDYQPMPQVQIPASIVLSTYTPTVGDLVYVDASDGKYKPADSSAAAKANVVGAVVGPIPGGTLAAGSAFVLQPCGGTMPLSAFGTLSQLNALGNATDAYIGTSSVPGRIVGAIPASGQYKRKVFTSPKRFADLVEADRTAVYVVLATGDAAQVP